MWKRCGIYVKGRIGCSPEELYIERGSKAMFKREEIVAVFNKDELQNGLKKYVEIMEYLHKTDVSEDREFQKMYNHFYRMRQRKPEFYQMYYDYMEKMKNNAAALTFEDVFSYIQKETNRCEASFSSKLLATLNPDKPIWDMFVLENLGVKKIQSSAKNRERKIIEAYQQIEQWYIDFFGSEEASLILQIFDEMFPNVKITDTKKVDLFLWKHFIKNL